LCPPGEARRKTVKVLVGKCELVILVLVQVEKRGVTDCAASTLGCWPFIRNRHRRLLEIDIAVY
jgi:hypothetical protein